MLGDCRCGGSLAVLSGNVGVGVTSIAIAGAASPGDLAQVVVTSSADAGMVTVGVTDLADARAASLANAGMVTVGVTDLADARAASLADAGMAFPADPAGVATIGVASLADATWSP